MVDIPEYRKFSFNDLTVVQEGEVIPAFEGILTISQELEATFQLPYESLPEHLKTIVITLTSSKDDSEFSFILSINQDKSYYQATIGSLPQIGSYEAVISIFDYRTREVIQRSGEVVVAQQDLATPIQRIETIIRINWPLIVGLTLVLLLVLLLSLRYRNNRHGGKPVLDKASGGVSLDKLE